MYKIKENTVSAQLNVVQLLKTTVEPYLKLK